MMTEGHFYMRNNEELPRLAGQGCRFIFTVLLSGWRVPVMAVETPRENSHP